MAQPQQPRNGSVTPEGANAVPGAAAIAPAGPEEHAAGDIALAKRNADGNQQSTTPFAGNDNKGKAPAPAAAELPSGHEADGEGGLDGEGKEKRKDFKPSTGLTSEGMLGLLPPRDECGADAGCASAMGCPALAAVTC